VNDGGEASVEAGREAAVEEAARVWVGVPDEQTNLKFEALDGDGLIPIRRGGQGGTHALIAIQCKGFGNRVVYQVTMKNLDGEGEIATLPLPRPRPIVCENDGVCRVSPLFVLLGGLAPPEDWDGLHVEVTATVANEDGLEGSGTATGILTTD
jgi:hypothetical protein